jgi:hypothetical protein
MADALSVTTFVVGDRLPWPDDAPDSREKGPFDPAAIHHNGRRQDCVVRKISTLGVTLGGELAPALGDAVAVELETGQRVAGRVAWTGTRELGVRFGDCVDVLALLNRKLVSQARERRTTPRLEVRCTVHIKCGEHFVPATLRNISARGLQIEGEGLPAQGAYVAAFVEGLSIPPGEVVWRRGNLAGIELFEELSWTSIIPWVRNSVRKSTS